MRRRGIECLCGFDRSAEENWRRGRRMNLLSLSPLSLPSARASCPPRSLVAPRHFGSLPPTLAVDRCSALVRILPLLLALSPAPLGVGRAERAGNRAKGHHTRTEQRRTKQNTPARPQPARRGLELRFSVPNARSQGSCAVADIFITERTGSFYELVIKIVYV